MDEFVSSVNKFKTFLSHDGDERYVVSIQPHEDNVRMIGSYGGILSARQDYEKINNHSGESLHQRLARCFMDMRAGKFSGQ